MTYDIIMVNLTIIIFKELVIAGAILYVDTHYRIDK